MGVILRTVIDPTEGKGTDSSRWEGPDLSEGSFVQRDPDSDLPPLRAKAAICNRVWRASFSKML